MSILPDYLQPLYKRTGSRNDDTTRELRWQVETYGDMVVISAGRLGGKQTETVKRIQGKNLGKVNETTPEQQAELEARALWTRQVQRKLYQTSEQFEAQAAALYQAPMLALDATKVGHRIDWEKAYVAQPKLNGVRCVALPDGRLQSREGKLYRANHVAGAVVRSWGGAITSAPLDGELYIPGCSELSEITSALKPGSPRHLELEYHVFDFAPVIGSDMDIPFWGRLKLLNQWFSEKVTNIMPLKFVPWTDCSSFADMASYHDTYYQQGYEGLILRDPQALYDHGVRSTAMFKYKTFEDSEFLIHDVIPANDGRQGIFVCKTDTGTFRVRIRGTDAYRQLVLAKKHEFIGKHLTVRYSQMLKSGVPEFPVGITCRDYE